MLNSKQLKCIELMVSSNKTQRSIAKELDVREETVSRWKKEKEFKIEFDKQMKDSINLSSALAYQTIMKLMNAKSEMVRFYAAKDLLDRAGYIYDKNQQELEQYEDDGFLDAIDSKEVEWDE